jgi:hypothetical protein
MDFFLSSLLFMSLLSAVFNYFVKVRMYTELRSILESTTLLNVWRKLVSLFTIFWSLSSFQDIYYQ